MNTTDYIDILQKYYMQYSIKLCRTFSVFYILHKNPIEYSMTILYVYIYIYIYIYIYLVI